MITFAAFGLVQETLLRKRSKAEVLLVDTLRKELVDGLEVILTMLVA